MDKSSEEVQREAIQKKAEKRKQALDRKYKKPETVPTQRLGEDFHDVITKELEYINLEAPVYAKAEAPVSTEKEVEVRLTKDHFEPLALIGRGAFGEVRIVRMKDRSTNDIYGTIYTIIA